jgi:Lrp/AsnC family leucine-responsive transcriptional regulator
MRETDRLDNIDLKIIKLLSMNSRTPFKRISSSVCISPNAVKARVAKLTSQKIIQQYVVRVNPIIFGYEKECFLVIRSKIRKETDLLIRLNLLGDILVYAKQLGGASIFAVALKPGAEDKIKLLYDIINPAAIEITFVKYSPISMNISVSDLNIIKCLALNTRIEVSEIAKYAEISTKTVERRLEKMLENHLLEFTIIRDLSSMQMTGYIEFAVIIKINDRSHYSHILKKIYYDLEEYLMFVLNENQDEMIFAVFFCANISTVNAILIRIESFSGVTRTDLFITTKLIYYQEWLLREIDKRKNLNNQRVIPGTSLLI